MEFKTNKHLNTILHSLISLETLIKAQDGPLKTCKYFHLENIKSGH